mgnify:FL=1
MPYKYIKGHEVVMDEHMLSATELAKIYGLYTLNNNPNGLLVTRILADYVSSNNLNVSEYYYPHRQGVMRVYPSFIYEKALTDFVFRLEEDKEYVYIVNNRNEKRKINYKFKKRQYGTIISIIEGRQ